MTIPLIVLLAALGFVVGAGIYVVHVGDGHEDPRTSAVGFGLIAVAIACCAALGVYSRPGPTCRLAPSSLVENPK